MKNTLNTCNFKRIVAIVVVLVGAFFACTTVSANALTLTATAKIDAEGGAYMRSTPSTSSDKNKIKLINDNKKITINKEVFTSKKSTAKKYKWYYITYSGKKGYVRSDCVDTIKYSAVKGTTTDAVYYRVGPNTSFSNKDILKKGTTVSRYLKAYLKGDSQAWYKIKKGSKYYYVSGQYVGAYQEPVKAPAITTIGLTYPTSIWQGVPFYLRGTISSDKTIEQVRIGIRNSENKIWVGSSRPAENNNVNAYTFDISTLDAQVSFGKLSKGSYIYRVDAYVEGKWRTVVKKDFTVKVIKTGKGAAAIAEQALALAWPDDKDVRSEFEGGAATDQFNAAFGSVFPGHSSWGNKFTKVGADCGVFVATVIRSCGYDTEFTYNLTNNTTGLFATMPKDTTRWQQLINYHSADEIVYDLNESLFKSGDIIMYHKKSGGQHILIYVRENGVGYMLEAGNTGDASTSYYGRKDKATSKITSLSKYTDFYVYRAAK